MYRRIAIGVLIFVNLFTFPENEGHAQVPPITSSGLNTQVSNPVDLGDGFTQYNVTGGTRPEIAVGVPGPNLFHSFGEFGVPENNIVNFQNESINGVIPATSNILSRVTGGNPSNILGMIQTSDFGNANIFIMNPAGIIFGADASLNVGGAAHFTTADYIKLGDNVLFTAVPSDHDAVLSVSPVASFGFLNQNPAPISVEESVLSVEDGQTISFIGGIQTFEGEIIASGGEIRIASVASPGEILDSGFDFVPNINGESFTTMGDISLLENTTLDVSSDSAGTVIIRGGQLEMINATISADTDNSNGAETAVDIQLSGDLSVEAELDPAISARSLGAGNAGEIRIESENMDLIAGIDLFQSITTVASGTGKAGNVSITTGDLQVVGDLDGDASFIDTGTAGEGSGGDITITAESFTMENMFLNTGDNFDFDPFDPFGRAGNLTIFSDNLIFASAGIFTESLENEGGNVTLAGGNLRLISSEISASGWEGGGQITFNAQDFTAVQSRIESRTFSEPSEPRPPAGITITANTIELRNGSQLITSTSGNGDAGSIQVTATERVSILGNSLGFQPSGIFSNSFGGNGPLGNAGTITISTPLLEMTNGGRINSATQSQGLGGNVTVDADRIVISGQQPVAPAQPIFGLGNQLASGIYTSTLGDASSCEGPCGAAGEIFLKTGSLILEDGAQLDSGTSSTGRGGDITVEASIQVLISGTLEDGTPGGIFSRTIGDSPNAGAGGSISVEAGTSLSLSDHATITASSSGTANAGEQINLTAKDTISINNSTITAQADNAFGGNIKLKAENLIQITNSEITSKVQEGSANAGSINIDPQFIVVKNSRIDTSANIGNGGDVSFVADSAILIDPFSTIDTSSQFGGSGNIDIRAPIQNLSGTLAPLPEEILKVSGLFAARCAAQKGGTFSSFVQDRSVRNPLGTTGFLSSPLKFDRFESQQPLSVARLESPTSFNSSELRSTTHSTFLIRDPAQGCTPIIQFRS